jgi:hypothetical protein
LCDSQKVYSRVKNLGFLPTKNTPMGSNGLRLQKDR